MLALSSKFMVKLPPSGTPCMNDVNPFRSTFRRLFKKCILLDEDSRKPEASQGDSQVASLPVRELQGKNETRNVVETVK